jgi:hypothetical protein
MGLQPAQNANQVPTNFSSERLLDHCPIASNMITGARQVLAAIVAVATVTGAAADLGEFGSTGVAAVPTSKSHLVHASLGRSHLPNSHEHRMLDIGK